MLGVQRVLAWIPMKMHPGEVCIFRMSYFNSGSHDCHNKSNKSHQTCSCKTIVWTVNSISQLNWFLTPDVKNFQRHFCPPLFNWVRTFSSQYNMSAYTASNRTYFVCTAHLGAAANIAWLWGANMQPSKTWKLPLGSSVGIQAERWLHLFKSFITTVHTYREPYFSIQFS